MRFIWIWTVLFAMFLTNSASGQQRQLQFRPDSAERGEQVTIVLNSKFDDSGPKDRGRIQVYVAGIEAKAQLGDQGIVFEVPTSPLLSGGPQEVIVKTGDQRLIGTLNVIGNTAKGRLMLVLKPDPLGEQAEDRRGQIEKLVRAVLNKLNFAPSDRQVVQRYRPLGGPKDSPCGGDLADIDVNGAPLGAVLEELKRQDVVLYADPTAVPTTRGQTTGPTTQASSYLQSIRQNARYSGKGVTIAVLDTGVSADKRLGARLLSVQGYDAFSGNTGSISSSDQFAGTPASPVGHGTPVALLAAGTGVGVAQRAEVLPVRVCDKTGACQASDVLAGLCYALSYADKTPETRLVINLSLGGDTPVEAIRSVLGYAIGKGIPVAAAAGNAGCGCGRPAPRHYPAAYDLSTTPDPTDDLDGLMSVAALAQDISGAWHVADFSTRGDYIDLAAPGVIKLSVGGTLREYRGTSFATPLVAGALALMREAAPTGTPLDFEARLNLLALPLPDPVSAVGSGMLDLNTLP